MENKNKKSSPLSHRGKSHPYRQTPRQTALTCPVQRPTTRSAMKVSSVSPERWDTMTPQPLDWASLHLRKDTSQTM